VELINARGVTDKEYIARSQFGEIEELAALAQRMSENTHTAEFIWALIPKIEAHITHLKTIAPKQEKTEENANE
jgi:hypothetical protein